MQLLNKATLGWLASSSSTLSPNQAPVPPLVGVPNYDAARDLSPGILHIGVGNFFRAHFANYLDQLFNQDVESHQQWGVIGAAVQDGSYSHRRQVLESQDMLYTLVERNGHGAKARIVSSILELLPYDPKFSPVREKLQDPNIKIVSTCITEGGYYLCPSTGSLDIDHPKIQHDIYHPEDPQTILGVLVQALRQRREAGISPFTVVCCDNIPHNGDTTRHVVCRLAELQDADLSRWIQEKVCFPNSMVDRITPKTGQKEIAFVQETYGIQDEDPVFCEPFIQWVMEDKFVNGERPALEKVGVQFVENVEPYELAKLRVLNGGHASLCYPAALLGIEYVHEAMDHPLIGTFLDCLERTEIVPGVPPLPDISAVDYWETIQERFKNPTIYDRIDRNCEDGSDRQPKFTIPAIKAAIDHGSLPLDGLALVSAMWCRYCQGIDEAGNKFPPNDKNWKVLTAAAQEAKTNPSAWLAMKEIYGAVGEDKRFSDAFAKALRTVNEQGVEAAMRSYIANNIHVLPNKENIPALTMSG
jgi:mannitol 2-dehydrogenase